MMAVIIRLQNLPLSASASSIRTFFQGLKIPDGGVNIVGGEDGDAFIAFGTDDDARQAMHLNGQKINGVSIRLLLSSKQEMQKIITDAQNGGLKRNVPLPPTDNINQNDKRSITYFNPEPTPSRENFDMPPNAKMRIIDHSVNNNNYFNGDFNTNNNKENNLYNEPPRPSEFSYRIARPNFPSNTVREEPSTYRYDTPEYAEYTSNCNFHPQIYEEIAPQFRYNSQRESPGENSFDKNNEFYDEQQLRKTLLPNPPVNDRPQMEMNDRPAPDEHMHMYDMQPNHMHDRQSMHRHPMLIDDRPEIQGYERPEIPLYQRSDMPEYERSERAAFERSEMPLYERSDMLPYERSDMPPYERSEIQSYDRQEIPIYDRFETSNRDRSDMFENDRWQMPIHDRSPMPMQDRPPMPIRERLRMPIHDRLRMPIHERLQIPNRDRQQLPLNDRPQMQMLRRDIQVPSNLHHNYNERPQWLEDSKTVYVPPITNCLVRIYLPPSIISHRTILDLFRNINVVPKRGIKMEQDTDKRLTGYVYVLFINVAEATKALKLNKKVFRGIVINVESIPDEDFEKVVDNFDDAEQSGVKTIKECSPYYRDLCLEISNIPVDITESDLKDYLNISINNKNLHFMQQNGSGYCLLTASDTTMMENILKFSGVTYRGSIIKITAISKFQLQAFLSKRSKPAVVTQKSIEVSKNNLSCVKFEELAENTKAVDIKQILLPVVVPLPNIIMNKSDCIVNLLNAASCLNVINDLKSRSEIKFLITPISNIEFQSLKGAYLNAPVGQKSVSSANKRPYANVTPKIRPIAPSSSVRMKNFPTTITTNEIKDLIRNFYYQPISMSICYDKGRNLGEAILTFADSTEAVEFKDEFHGMWYIQKELEVLLSEN